MPVPLIPGDAMPAACHHGHPWATPGSYTLSWMTCLCPGGLANFKGHYRIRCQAPGCTSAWYWPEHQPGGEVPVYPGPPC